MGRLPWFAAPFLRAFFFRALFAMVTSSSLVGCPLRRDRRGAKPDASGPPMWGPLSADGTDPSAAAVGRPPVGWSPVRPGPRRRLPDRT